MLEPVTGVDESYHQEMQLLVNEVGEAIERADMETLAVISNGRALATFRHAAEARKDQANQEKLVGSAVQSWDSRTQTLVALFLIARHVGRWRQFRETWTLEKRGRAWFVVDRQVARVSKT